MTHQWFFNGVVCADQQENNIYWAAFKNTVKKILQHKRVNIFMVTEKKETFAIK